MSLFGFAITINSAILIVASASFYYGLKQTNVGDLYDAYHLIKQYMGSGAARALHH